MTTPARLDREGIAARIPHSGAMCLLDALVSWDATHVRCHASSHRDATNPLRSPGGLLAPVAIEYASQAMALHGALTAAHGQPPSAGYLAAAREVRLLVPRLDDVEGVIVVSAERTAGSPQQAIYRFALHDERGRLLVDGRATVVLAPALTSA